MVRTMLRVHTARLQFGCGHIGMRHLPWHADDELHHRQQCKHPVYESVTHDVQPTPLAAIGEGARPSRVRCKETAFIAPPGRRS